MATILLLAMTLQATSLSADDLPRLSKTLDPKKQSYGDQEKLPDLPTAYVSTSPENLGDGIQVGTLDLPGTTEAVEALIADDRAGKYQNLDSLLLWKDGKLLFEMYNRGGRVDGPHYAMSVTKTLTSVTLARAIQVGLLNMTEPETEPDTLISDHRGLRFSRPNEDERPPIEGSFPKFAKRTTSRTARKERSPRSTAAPLRRAFRRFPMAVCGHLANGNSFLIGYRSLMAPLGIG